MARWLVCALLLGVSVASADVDPAWALYDRAFERLGRHEDDAAKADLDRVIAQFPEHPAAHAARARLLDLGLAAQARDAEAKAAPDRIARGELVFWSTIGGLYVGANLCVDHCTSEREGSAVYSLSAGGALAIAVLASGNVKEGEAQLYNSAQVWGAWNAFGWNDGFAHTSGQAYNTIAAQAGGLLAGIGLWRAWHPTSGDVALANSGLLWGTVLSAFGQLAVSGNAQLDATVAYSDLGLLAAAVLSSRVSMSRGRTLLLDLGGVLGMLGGGLVALSLHSDQQVGASFLVGTSLGLGLSAVATRNWDDAPSLPVTFAPARIGHGWGLALSLAR